MHFNAVDTVWLMTCSALVLLMTPGLALFYGGMVRAKSVLNMMMMSFASIGVVTLIWVFYGYSLAFGPDHGLGFVGDFSDLGLSNALVSTIGAEGHQVPTLVFAFFQLTFAIVTTALLSGAVADRIKFTAWLALIAAWVTFIYIPLAHMAFASQNGDGGLFIDRLGVLDFAGGTAVEINSGASALALALVIGKRVGFKRDPMRPHSLPLVLLGAGLLWFGWFGFNAGSALAATGVAVVAIFNTQIAAAAAALSWIAVEWKRDGRPTTLGVASGAVAGAVAITPSCGYVTPMGALVIGLVAGAVCAWAIGLKYRFGYDDSLDVVGVHGVGGAVGMLAIGLIASSTANDAIGDGLFNGGGAGQLVRQTVGIALTAAFAFAGTWLIATIIDRLIGLRIDTEAEIAGVDTAEHAESAYDFAGVVGAGHVGGSHHSGGHLNFRRNHEE
ncbi:MAG: hypothetical protein RL441_438 [Actinomycetota bacterium]